MADEPKPAWLNWLAVTTIIFSACATLSTFKGGGFSTRSILAQTNAANMWAYIQSKSVKQHTCELQRDALELQVMSVQGPQALVYQAKIDECKRDIERYDKEKAEAMAKAREFENDRVQYQINSRSFGLAVVFLQVAIMLSALAALLKFRTVWYGGIGTGAVGLFWFCDAIWHILT
jgi:hypothetical protein